MEIKRRKKQSVWYLCEYISCDRKMLIVSHYALSFILMCCKSLFTVIFFAVCSSTWHGCRKAHKRGFTQLPHTKKGVISNRTTTPTSQDKTRCSYLKNGCFCGMDVVWVWKVWHSPEMWTVANLNAVNNPANWSTQQTKTHTKLFYKLHKASAQNKHETQMVEEDFTCSMWRRITKMEGNTVAAASAESQCVY